LSKIKQKIANPLQRWTHKHCDKCTNIKLNKLKNKHEMLKMHDVNVENAKDLEDTLGQKKVEKE
jgi:hypothetical protein